jgi:hypothetical protein
MTGIRKPRAKKVSKKRLTLSPLVGKKVATLSPNLPSRSTIVVSDSKSPKRPSKKAKEIIDKREKSKKVVDSLIPLILNTYLKKQGFDEKDEEKAITYLYDAWKCGVTMPCLLSEGVYGAAYQLKDANHNIIVKLPKSAKRPKGYGDEGDGFDEWEIKFNQLAYEIINTLVGDTFGENLIAKPLGFWKSPSLSKRGFSKNDFVFVYNFEPSLNTYAELVRTTAISKHDFKVIMFQVVLMLDVLQSDEPGFCHNDMHGYNILVKKNDKNVKFSSVGYGAKEQELTGKYIIKLLDFGMCSSNSNETKDGKRMWRQTRGCPMVDFLMFCNKSLMYASAYNAKTKKYQEWNQDLLSMTGRLFPPQAIKNGDGTGQWLDEKYLHLTTAEGYAWIKKEFPKDTFPLLKVLNDVFFH